MGTTSTTSAFAMKYRGSIFWLIFWLIFFFPIAFVLLLTATTFIIGYKVYVLQYEGSRFWLGFWVLVFFPIAFLLLLLNGLSITVEDKDTMTAEKIETVPIEKTDIPEEKKE